MNKFIFLIITIWIISTAGFGWVSWSFFDMAWYFATLITIIPTLILCGFLWFISELITIQ